LRAEEPALSLSKATYRRVLKLDPVPRYSLASLLGHDGAAESLGAVEGLRSTLPAPLSADHPLHKLRANPRGRTVPPPPRGDDVVESALKQAFEAPGTGKKK
jgi:hypothetical protein